LLVSALTVTNNIAPPPPLPHFQVPVTFATML